jgi:uncharacterized protein involved in response to NO
MTTHEAAVAGVNGMGLAGLAIVTFEQNTMALPSVTLAVAFYAIVGYFTIRRHGWARWALVVLLLMQSLTTFAFAFVGQFSPLLVAVAGLLATPAVVLMRPVRSLGRTTPRGSGAL